MPATAKEWDQVRAAFATSIMVDTALSSLAQNLEGPDWPIKGKDETPAAYIDLSFEEATELLALKGQPPERIDTLIGILSETLSFDDPFGEMVEQSVANEAQDNPITKNLAKLGIPENFPITLTALSTGTLEFCALEKLGTIGEFAIFAQGMSQSVIVGGDFKTLLNALSHVDEKAIATFLPSRPGQRGLFLPETVALIVRSLSPTVHSGLAAAPGTLPSAAQVKVNAAVAFFPEQAAALKHEAEAGVTWERLLSSLGDPAVEAAVSAILTKALAIELPSAKKGGWFGRLFGR